jgi:hypothetical protein
MLEHIIDVPQFEKTPVKEKKHLAKLTDMAREARNVDHLAISMAQERKPGAGGKPRDSSHFDKFGGEPANKRSI